eukprot:CAMPEP_0114578308 /NCGR_PEP_ID=MMETSP0125-20121206/2869_1 /TAXON_ID=485358 ORGANISM="Aristerostoma sp., Strain ATCC 50986" /NCGR_SAMPLE_ID=MMETSP0125 /ASSEMBLY_ACC=CAM_ASM_000245 /LENGTH=54 /DNA_ID=CAMNT_0001768291 /DNA_START=193 /DNA_END=357 /DNA_ORIENTATION=-
MSSHRQNQELLIKEVIESKIEATKFDDSFGNDSALALSRNGAGTSAADDGALTE